MIFYTEAGTPYTTFEWNGHPRRRYLQEIKCAQCGAPTFVDRNNYRRYGRGFCSPACHSAAQTGNRNTNWTGGRKYKSSGHVLVYAPDHPAAKKNFVPEHRLVAERELGRYLNEEEIVHHINCVKDDNRPENLSVVPSKTAHNLAHASLNSLVKPLLEMGIIHFDRQTQRYEICRN